MTKNRHIKAIQSIKYYTGAHPVIKSLNKQNSRPTEFGHKVWATTLVLIDFLYANKFNLENKTALEVGCGWGILGSFLAKQYNCQVTCTDIDEKVLPFTQAHAKLNSIKINTLARGFTDISDEDLKATQIITGVEVCYSTEVAIDLLNLISRAYKFGVEQIFIADPGRPDFLEILCKNEISFNKNIYLLPGTKNGKTTQLLHLTV